MLYGGSIVGITAVLYIIRYITNNSNQTVVLVYCSAGNPSTQTPCPGTDSTLSRCRYECNIE